MMADIRFAVLGDSHIGYKNGGTVFKNLLLQAVKDDKKFVFFGGDNVHGGVGTGEAEGFYKQFNSIVKGILGPKEIPYRASIGNWETTTRSLFGKYMGDVVGKANFPATLGRVKFIWLDNANGAFSQESLGLLKRLNANHYYVIDFHWPLRLMGVPFDNRHMVSKAETDRFFHAIPPKVRNRVLAIFTHHAHTFFRIESNIYPGFPNTKFYVTGCSGCYRCSNPGYYDAVLTIRNDVVTVRASIKY